VAFALSGFYLAYFALVGVYIIFLPKMLAQSGYSPKQIGLIFSASPMMRFILPFIFQRLNGINRGIYLLSLIILIVATLFFIVTLSNFWLFFMANILYGSAMGVILPYIDAVALMVIKRERYGKVRLWGSIGFMAIALWLGSILKSPLESLIYMAILALIVLIFGWRLSIYDKGIDSSKIDSGEEFSLLRHWAFWLSALLLQFSFGGFYNFFTIYETSRGLSLEATSWLWSFGVLCEIVMLNYQGRLLRGNLLNLIEFATFITAIRWALLWLNGSSLTVALISQSLHSITFALYYTSAIAYIFDLYKDKKLAQQFFLGITFGLGGSLGAVVAGYIYESYPDGLFLFEAIIALLAWVAIKIHKRRRGV